MIELLKKNKKTGKVIFQMKNINPVIANTLRRQIVEAVPTMAIEDVELVKNSSALYDEMIAHRLGLVPLKTDLKSYNLKEECKCDGEGCAKCTLKLTLKAKGPCTVYSGDLKSQDPKVKPTEAKLPIVKLLKGQELELLAIAQLGIGKNHVKHTPGLAWYEYKPKIVEINDKHPDLEKFKSKYPPQIFKNGKIDKKVIEDEDLYEACEGVNDKIIKIEKDESIIIFSIEPWGQLTPAEMLAKAAEKFKEKLTEFADKIK